MVNLFNFDNINDRHGDVDVDGDVNVVHFVKAEGRYLLVVIVLEGDYLQKFLLEFTHLHEEEFTVVFV